MNTTLVMTYRSQARELRRFFHPGSAATSTSLSKKRRGRYLFQKEEAAVTEAKYANRKKS
jgi:hypothetical protein